MLRHRPWIAVATSIAIGGAVGASGCRRALVRDPNDLTVPAVVLEVRGADGAYRPATETTFTHAFSGDHALELRCRIRDSGGVSRGTLRFRGSSARCGAALTGLPDPQTRTVPSGAAVIDAMPLTVALRGGVGCAGGAGVLDGERVEVACTGENWSANPSTRRATRVLAIELRR